MSRDNMNVVLVLGAWADGPSWAKAIGPLSENAKVLAPETSFTRLICSRPRPPGRRDGLHPDGPCHCSDARRKVLSEMKSNVAVRLRTMYLAALMTAAV
jgi:hypothetical protein